MTSEFIIWGKDANNSTETLLVSEAAGIKTRDHAERFVKTLVEDYGCYDCRIQEFRMSDGSEVIKMFAAAI